MMRTEIPFMSKFDENNFSLENYMSSNPIFLSKNLKMVVSADRQQHEKLCRKVFQVPEAKNKNKLAQKETYKDQINGPMLMQDKKRDKKSDVDMTDDKNELSDDKEMRTRRKKDKLGRSKQEYLGSSMEPSAPPEAKSDSEDRHGRKKKDDKHRRLKH